MSVLVAGLAMASSCKDDGARAEGSGDGGTQGVPTTGADGTAGQDTGNDGDGDGGTGSATTGNDSADEGADDAPVIFDVGSMPDGGGTACGGGDGGSDPDFSFLWAANSTQGTISKIDTQTVTEVGRYIVRPDSAGSPSRTSVSLSGHVAVANRNGGITKIWATEDYCQDQNGQPGIQTSTDSNYLPWGQDDCVAWHTPFNYESQRPVAWTQGEWNGTTCTYENEMVWTSGRIGTTIEVLLLDGEDGTLVDSVAIPGLNQDQYGIYGGAVDGDGNFWGSQLGSTGRLVKVDIDDMTYQVWDTPSGPHWYGMTVDSDGFVWLCSATVGRFDPTTETWMTNSVGGYTGCMADAEGLLWMSSFNGVVGVDRQTLQVAKTWPTPGAYGISVDFYGYVWAVAFGNSAHRVDPDTGDVTSYNGLVGAYTYSDMTGFALSQAGTPSG